MHLKYIQFLLVNYTLIKIKKTKVNPQCPLTNSQLCRSEGTAWLSRVSAQSHGTEAKLPASRSPYLEAPGKTHFPAHSCCWQNSVPCCRTEDPVFLLAVSQGLLLTPKAPTFLAMWPPPSSARKRAPNLSPASNL